MTPLEAIISKLTITIFSIHALVISTWAAYLVGTTETRIVRVTMLLSIALSLRDALEILFWTTNMAYFWTWLSFDAWAYFVVVYTMSMTTLSVMIIHEFTNLITFTVYLWFAYLVHRNTNVITAFLIVFIFRAT